MISQGEAGASTAASESASATKVPGTGTTRGAPGDRSAAACVLWTHPCGSRRCPRPGCRRPRRRSRPGAHWSWSRRRCALQPPPPPWTQLWAAIHRQVMQGVRHRRLGRLAARRASSCKSFAHKAPHRGAWGRLAASGPHADARTVGRLLGRAALASLDRQAGPWAWAAAAPQRRGRVSEHARPQTAHAQQQHEKHGVCVSPVPGAMRRGH